MNTQNLLVNSKADQLLSHLPSYFLNKEETRPNPFFSWKWTHGKAISSLLTELHITSDLSQDVPDAPEINKLQNVAWAPLLPLLCVKGNTILHLSPYTDMASSELLSLASISSSIKMTAAQHHDICLHSTPLSSSEFRSPLIRSPHLQHEFAIIY